MEDCEWQSCRGGGWTETANIYTLGYDNAYIGYGCGFNSQRDAEFTLHATGESGWHFIDLYPAIYKGSEARPLNFRLPQLSFAQDHLGKDLPGFRFAFEVTDGSGSTDQANSTASNGKRASMRYPPRASERPQAIDPAD